MEKMKAAGGAMGGMAGKMMKGSGQARKSLTGMSAAPKQIGEIKLFQKTLNDVIKGMRNTRKDQAKYVAQVMKEIKEELKSDDMRTKVTAVQKLTYLHMMGYDMSWASFHIVEIMSSPRFSHKRIGYLAAAQCFDDTTDVILLTTNLFKKNFASSSQYEVGLAISCLSNIATPDLCEALVADVVAKLGASTPYVRKKAVLSLYKIYVRYPDALKPTFPRLKSKLSDDEPSVVSAAVNVITELARKNPRNFLGLAPVLFNILTTSSNNWMIIKVVKLMGALLPLEPRLVKKLSAPMANILSNTQAKSLLYECIYTVLVGMKEDTGLVKLASEKLRLFIEDEDQNLKFLGLVALEKLLDSHPRLVVEYRDVVMKCLVDKDVTIREQAVRVIGGMATRRSIADIVERLLDHATKAEGAYRDFLIQSIVDMCAKENYARISDFEWYVSLLVQLGTMQSTVCAENIAKQLMDVCIRVKAVRGYTASMCTALLLDARLMAPKENTKVLVSAAYISGENAALTLTEDGDAVKTLSPVMRSLLDSRVLTLPSEVQQVYVHAALKILVALFAHAGDGDLTELQEWAIEAIGPFTLSADAEVQERSCLLQQMLKIVSGRGEEIGVAVDSSALVSELPALFQPDLLPVSSKAQRKVKAKCNLKQWIGPKPPQISASELKADPWKEVEDPTSFYDGEEQDDEDDEDDGEAAGTEGAPAKKLAPRSSGSVFYLGDDGANGDDVDQIPIAKLDLDLGGLGEDEPKKSKKSKKKSKKARKAAEEAEAARPDVLVFGDDDDDDDVEAVSSDEEDLGDLSKLKDGDVAMPQAPQHRQVTTSEAKEGTEGKKDKKKKKKDKKDKKKKDKEGKEAKADQGEAMLLDFGEEPAQEAAAAADFYADEEGTKKKKKDKKSKEKGKKDKKDKKEKKSKKKRKGGIVVFADDSLRVTCAVTGSKKAVADEGGVSDLLALAGDGNEVAVDVAVEVTFTSLCASHLSAAALHCKQLQVRGKATALATKEGTVAGVGAAGLAPKETVTASLTVRLSGQEVFEGALGGGCTVEAMVRYDALMPVEAQADYAVKGTSLLTGTAITMESYEQLMRDTDRLAHTTAGRVDLKATASLKEALTTICSAVGLYVTASTETAATLYGEAVAGAPPAVVCVMLKMVDAAVVGVSVRGSCEGLPEEVMKELRAIL